MISQELQYISGLNDCRWSFVCWVDVKVR